MSRVLLIDDNSLIRDGVRLLFENRGYEVCGEAADGKEGIEKAERLHPDLIVLDLSMPVMNGLEEAEIISKKLPTTPVILLSNYAGVVNKEEAHSGGISALVSKETVTTSLLIQLMPCLESRDHGVISEPSKIEVKKAGGLITRPPAEYPHGGT